ncbi:MAG: hypothetical protein ACI8P2_000033 [Candidatus Latescibacterota bacterium]
MNENSTIENELMVLPESVAKLARDLGGQLEIANGDFEESLLDQELWASVDLLETIGIKHHQLFNDVASHISSGESVDKLKGRVRAGRADIGDWLFLRFKDIAVQESPNEGAMRAFDHYLDQLGKICATYDDAPITVEQHAALFVRESDDRIVQVANKWLKRQLSTLLNIRYQRHFSPRALARFHLLLALPQKLLPIANMVGEAEFFLLRRVKALYEELDGTYNLFLASLDELEGKQAERDEMFSSAELVRDELDESFRLVGAEVMKYYEEIRQAMRNEVQGVCQKWIRDATRAGTLGWDGHSAKGSESAIRQGQRELQERLNNWGHYLIGFTGVHTMELEVARLQNSLRHAIDETVLGVNERLWEHLVEQCGAIEVKLDETIAILRACGEAGNDAEQVRIAVDRCREEFLDFLNNKVQRRLNSISASGEISQLIDILTERFHSLVESTVESFQIVEIEDLPMREGFVPRDVPLKMAPMRAVVRTYIESDLTHRLGDINSSMLDQIETVSHAVEQFWQTVNFSLGSVAVELREVGKEPRDLLAIALSRLRRVEGNFSEEIERVRNANKIVEEKTIAAVADIARRLRQMILEETVVEMRRQIGRSKKMNTRGDSTEVVEKQRPSSEVHEESIEGGKEGDLKRGGSEEEVGLGRAAVLGYEAILGLEQRIDEKVPFAYRRLFRTAPLEVSEFLRGRSEALGAIETAALRWSTGAFSAVALVGEQGSGKTSLVNCAMQQKLAGIPLVRHRIDSTQIDVASFAALLKQLLDARSDSIDDLQREIVASSARRIVILEDIHQLYLRAHGGLELLRRLLEFIDATGGQLLWIVTIDQYAWQYLDHAILLSRHFAFLIETGRLSRSELEGAIIARHQATGYTLRFVDSIGYREEEQVRLRRTFFDALSKACAGNVFAAIFYWLQSVRAVEANAVVIAPLEELQLQFLGAMPTEGMLSLGIVIQHGSLCSEHFCEIFHIPVSEARARLAHLERMGLLQVSGGGEEREYFVDPLLYHPVVLELERRNVVQ